MVPKKSTIMSLAIPRGGGSAVAAEVGKGLGGVLSTITSRVSDMTKHPSGSFNLALIGLAFTTIVFRLIPTTSSSDQNQDKDDEASLKPPSVKSLQIRFLSVFWLLRCADWLQGPYFYEVYASKIFGGEPASLSLISKLFLTGFASTALFGPLIGRLTDSRGRKFGTLLFAMLYSLGAASTKSNLLILLLAGRVMSGIGTSLLFSAPESWLVGESMKVNKASDYLGETFGLAYAGDSIVAIIAGQFASLAASSRGPTGPFELSVLFLVLGGILTSILWKENVAESSSPETNPTIREAVDVIRGDVKIALVGGVQSLFEAAMYIFVLQWPPAISRAVSAMFGEGAKTPYGTVFSCFMASCLLGSTLFGKLASSPSKISTEGSTSLMMMVATISMGIASFFSTRTQATPLLPLVAAFFAFETCVGMYFPSIGTLRSKYVPDSHRSVIMNLFGIPLNVLVVSVFLSIQKLGVGGALSVSTGALGLGMICMCNLWKMTAKEENE